MSHQSVTVRRRDNIIDFINNETHLGLRFTEYERANDFGKLMAYQARGIYTPQRTYIDKTTSIRREGDAIIVEKNDTVFVILPLASALELGLGMIGKAKELEEEASSEDLTMDQALLIRSGINLPVTNNDAIVADAQKEAQWGNLRKYLHAPAVWPRIGHIRVKRDKANAGN